MTLSVTPEYKMQDLTRKRRISRETVDEMTRLDQQKIRNSPLWDEMAFGEEEAERLLRQFRAEVK